jgi:hypothetical protein
MAPAEDQSSPNYNQLGFEKEYENDYSRQDPIYKDMLLITPVVIFILITVELRVSIHHQSSNKVHNKGHWEHTSGEHT